MRRCTKCGNEYPATTEFWHKGKNYKDGLNTWCKPCVAEKSRKWREINFEKNRLKRRERYLENREKELENARKWQEANKEKVREISRLWHMENVEKRRETNHKIYQENREDILKRTRKYYQDHKVAHRESVKKWTATHPDEINEYSNRRRAREINADGDFTAQDARNIYNFQNGRCKYCNADLEVTGKHLDHIIPLSRGGNNWPTNLQYLCPSCNTSKGNKLPWEWDSRYKPN